MGISAESETALLFAGLLFTDYEVLTGAEKKLRDTFGPLSLESPVTEWTHSDYYADELGPGIKRKYVLFDAAIRQEEIADIKLSTNEIEASMSVDDKRTVNIDPGYITLSKLVLATTKNFCHRIYLRSGIYAEVTLYFKDGSFCPTDFTYSDYKREDSIMFFLRARQLLKDRITY